MANWDSSQEAKLAQHTKIQIDLQIQCNLYQNPAAFFPVIVRLILILIWKCKGPIIVKTVLKNKDKVGRLHSSRLDKYLQPWQCGAGIGADTWINGTSGGVQE